MGSIRTRTKAKDWVRLAAKLSLLFTDPKLRDTISGQLKDSLDGMKERVEDVNDRVSSTYEDTADRLTAARTALQGQSSWPSRTAGFLLGVGIGAGLGILFALASGSETREAVRDKVGGVKNRIFESAA
jgi:gas vesicle protein